MDEKHTGYNLKAPGHPGLGASLRLPGRGPFPDVDDHLVEAEVTRDEIIGGRRMVASPAHPPHATQHSRLDYVLQAHVAYGYRVAVDLLTRLDQNADFASDACVFKDGVDPSTGGRYLEEIAFEVVSEQNERLVTEKAVQMHHRGVRRIFTVWVKTQRVCEWSPQTGSWRGLEAEAQIEDSCLVAPLAVAALLDAAAADNAVVQALAAKGNPEIRLREAAARSEGEARGRAEGKVEGKAEGKVEGKAEDILKILAARSVPASEAQRQEILRCRDLERLDHWLSRAILASSFDEVTSEP